MSKAKHTPGPWTVEDIFEDDDGGVEVVLGYDIPGEGSPIPIAHVFGVCEHGAPPDTDTEVAANARLIAAAPEMLEALRECVTLNGAFAFASQDFYKAKQRIMAINKIANDAIARATEEPTPTP